MKTLFIFELKKLFKQKLIWFLVGLTLIVTIGLYGFQIVMTATTRQQVLNQYDFSINLHLDFAETYRLEREEAIQAEDEAWIEEATEQENRFFQSYENVLSLKQDYQSGNYETILQDQLESSEWIVDPHIEGAYGIADQYVSDFTLRASYAENQYLVEKQIEPFVQNTTHFMFLKTAYDDFTGPSLESWENQTSRYSTQASYFMYQLIQATYLVVVILIGCFIFGNTFSSEIQKKTQKIRFTQVLPYKRGQLFIAKFSAGYLALLIYVAVMIGVPLIVATLFDQFGSLDYPILIYDGYTTNTMMENEVLDTFHFITLRMYFLKAILLGFASSLMIYGLYYLFSQWSKEPILTAISTVAVCYLGLLIKSPYNPFQYLMIDQVITKEIQLQTWNTSFHYSTGVLLIFTLGLLFVYLSYRIFKRKF